MLHFQLVLCRLSMTSHSPCHRLTFYFITLKLLLYIRIKFFFFLNFLITSGSNPNPCFISPQALVYQRWEPCWLVLKCLITWLSLICLPSFWALPVHWQPAALFSWAKWWETSQYTCFTFKICSCSLKLFVACFVMCYERFSIFVKGSICASFHHGWSLPEQALHSYRSQ